MSISWDPPSQSISDMHGTSLAEKPLQIDLIITVSFLSYLHLPQLASSVFEKTKNLNCYHLRSNTRVSALVHLWEPVRAIEATLWRELEPLHQQLNEHFRNFSFFDSSL